MRRVDPGNGSAALAAWAGLLADRTRAAFCLALLDGRAWIAGELARHAGVAASTASEHLDRLVTGGLLRQHRQGRHRYLRLASPEVASAIEMMTATAGHRPEPVRSLSAANRLRALAYARTCYDHLAGRLGVALTDAMTERGLLSWDGGLAVTPAGIAWLDQLGITLTRTPVSRRPIVRSCLDWTERRPHLAGTLGAAVCQHAFTAGWVTRINLSRAVRVTTAGGDALARQLGIDAQALLPDIGATAAPAGPAVPGRG